MKELDDCTYIKSLLWYFLTTRDRKVPIQSEKREKKVDNQCDVSEVTCEWALKRRGKRSWRGQGVATPAVKRRYTSCDGNDTV